MYIDLSLSEGVARYSFKAQVARVQCRCFLKGFSLVKQTLTVLFLDQKIRQAVGASGQCFFYYYKLENEMFVVNSVPSNNHN